MGFHIYCVAREGHLVPPDCTGLGGVRPRALEADGLALWASEHDDRVQPSIDAVRVHNGVVSAAMTTEVTPVPVRFGQWFATAAAALERLMEDAARWSALLDRFAGRAEYGVRVLRADQVTERDVQGGRVETGTEYMAALARKQAQTEGRRRDGEQIAADLARLIGRLAAEQRVEHSPTGALLVTLAHLVAWSDAAAYHTVLEAARVAYPDTQLLLTGPWPPYSFVE